MAVQKYLDENNILYQRVFRPKYSTDTCLSIKQKNINGFGNDMVTDMALIDLQKAFDTIDHEILFK